MRFLEWLDEQRAAPYVRGQAGPSGFDCSGFVEAWTQAFGDPAVSLPNPSDVHSDHSDDEQNLT